MKTISLVMIVKNEEVALPACLASVASLVDDYVIVDTGSTDGTRAIIARYTTAVYERPFDDFVTAKNHALGLARGDYILFMDADERLLGGHEQLRAAAENNVEGVAGLIVEGDIHAPCNEYYRMRLWKNSGAWRFVGPGIHEVVVGPSEGVEWRADVIVHHDHSHRTGQSYTERFTFYIDILLAALARDPNDTRAMFYLARTYGDAGRHLEAIDAYRRYRELGSWRDELWQSWYDEAVCWANSGEYARANAALSSAAKVDERRAEVDCLAGQLAFNCGDWVAAAEHYERALQKPKPTDVILFLNPLAYDATPREQLVVIYDKLRRYDMATEHAAELCAASPKPDWRRVNNLTFVRARKNRQWLFALGATPEPLHGEMLQTQGAGGVETTYIELPKALVAQGQTVTVQCRCEQAHVSDGVYFVPYTATPNWLKPDIVVSSRWYEPFNTWPARHILWLQDAWFGEPPDGIWSAVEQVVVSSPWHAHYVAQRAGHIAARKTSIIPLGIRRADFALPLTKKPYQVVYSSNPDRGLRTLVAVWDEITRLVPDVNLVVTYGWDGLLTWSNDSAWRASNLAFRDEMLAWAERAGNVRFTGRLTKPALYRVLAESSLCAYPNNFWETFCLTALEAQAAGTPLVTSDMGALATTCTRSGNILLPGNPLSANYRVAFSTAVAQTLFDQAYLADLRQKCLAHVATNRCDWSEIATMWLEETWRL